MIICVKYENLFESDLKSFAWGNKMEYSNMSYIFSESLEYLFTWTVIMFQCIYHPSQHTHQCQTSCCITLRKESVVFSCSQVGTAACTSVPGCVLWAVPSAWGTEGIERIHGGCTMAAVKCHLTCDAPVQRCLCTCVSAEELRVYPDEHTSNLHGVSVVA